MHKPVRLRRHRQKEHEGYGGEDPQEERSGALQSLPCYRDFPRNDEGAGLQRALKREEHEKGFSGDDQVQDHGDRDEERKDSSREQSFQEKKGRDPGRRHCQHDRNEENEDARDGLLKAKDNDQKKEREDFQSPFDPLEKTPLCGDPLIEKGVRDKREHVPEGLTEEACLVLPAPHLTRQGLPGCALSCVVKPPR